MKKQTLTRKELYELVWSVPFTELIKRYSISSERLKSICKRMEISIPKSGHWMKLQFNKPIEIEPLSENYTGENEIDLNEIEVGETKPQGSLSRLNTLEKEIIETEGKNLIVPSKLVNPSHLIILSKKDFEERCEDRWYRDDTLMTLWHSLRIRTTKKNIGRAFRFMDTFIKIMEKRGHVIEILNGLTYVIIQNEKIEISFREKCKRILKDSNSRWQEYDTVVSGVLSFNAKVHHREIQWTDEKIPLEDQMARIVAVIEIKGEELKKESIEREKYWAEQKRLEEIKREEKRILKEKQEQKEEELRYFKDLLKESKRWHKAEILKKYIDEVEANAKSNNSYTDKMRNWLIWARQKADWYHPFIESSDELLNECDRDSLTFEK
jgi:hypothetical protein